MTTRLPGIALCAAIGAVSAMGQHLQVMLLGHAWLATLVLAIVLGAGLRAAWLPPAAYAPGIRYASKTLLEIAVALIGVSFSFGMIAGVGMPLLFGTALVVAATLAAGICLGRLFGLSPRMSILLACGNAICGNSAIASVAPTIRATNDEVAAAIAFTAIPSIALVALLPVIAQLFELSPIAGGTLAGLTVYAVPQVIAAAAPLGREAVEIGTLVKLVRVLTLGPVVAALALLNRDAPPDQRRFSMRLLPRVPWFILAFLSLAALRSTGGVPDVVAEGAHEMSGALAALAMAGLGLSVDLKTLSRAGFRILAVVILSLGVLCGLAFTVLWATALM